METLLLRDDQSGISTAAKMLCEGKVVAIPTETVYGLAANAYDVSAVKNIFKAKGRPQDNPLIVHVSDLEGVLELTSLEELPQEVIKLAQNFWPGPLTIVLPKAKKVSYEISAGLDTVAIRMPSNEVARQIIKQSGVPLAAPSANLSGKPSPTCAEHVIEDLNGKIDGIVCSDQCSVGVESTVVSVNDKGCRVLRPGGITAEMLKDVLCSVELDKSVLSSSVDKKVSSPGMKYKHYSPNTNVYLVEGTCEQYNEYMKDKTDCCAICFEEDQIDGIKLVYGSNTDDSSLAHEIFSVLRNVDALGVKNAYVHAPSKSGVGLAVYNRLLRAAAFKVVEL